MYSRFCPELSQKGMEKLQRMTTSAGGEVEVEKQSDLKENKRNLMEKLAVFELEQKRNERLHLLMGVAVERRLKEERDMWKERAEQLSKENSRLVSLMSPPKQHSTPSHRSDSGNSLDLMEIPLRIHVNNLEAVREEIESEFKSSLSTESSSCLTGPSMHASLVENTSNSTVVQLQSVNNNNNMEDSEVFDETELKMPVESLSGPDVRLELVQEGGEKAVLVQWLMPTDTAGDAVRGYQVFVMEGGEAADGEGAWSQMGAELPASRLLGMECQLSDWRGSSSLVRVQVRAIDWAGSPGLFSSVREIEVV